MFGFDLFGCVITLIVAAIAGTLAGQIVRGKGYGPLGDVVIGLVGGIMGTMLFRLLGAFPGANLIVDLIIATIGAVIFVLGVRLFFNADFAK